jgi:hypothetical protein
VARLPEPEPPKEEVLEQRVEGNGLLLSMSSSKVPKKKNVLINTQHCRLEINTL